MTGVKQAYLINQYNSDISLDNCIALGVDNTEFGEFLFNKGINGDI